MNGVGLPPGDIHKEKARAEWHDWFVRRLDETLRKRKDIANAERRNDKAAVADMGRRLKSYRSTTEGGLQALHTRLKDAYGVDSIPEFKTLLTNFRDACARIEEDAERRRNGEATGGDADAARAAFRETVSGFTDAAILKQSA